MDVNYQEAISELNRRLITNRLLLYQPYPKQYDFHALGLKNRERALFAGNQIGKTLCASNEIAFHATGEYPDWWPGHKYDRAIPIWTGAKSWEKSREIIQDALYGCEVADLNHEDFGTGTVPKDKIVSVSKRQGMVGNIMDSCQVRHVSGGISTIQHKCYEQGWEKFTGKKVPCIWLDEEPTGTDGHKIYTECLTRTTALTDGRLMITFTPLSGITKVVATYQLPEDDEKAKPYVNMTLDEISAGGTWPEETPWAGEEWEGHISLELAAEMIAAWPSWERRTRRLGVPLAGEGLVFTIDEDEIKCNPVKYQNHWAKINGIDFGIDHPFGFAQLWHDRDQDIVYVAFTWRSSDLTPPTHVSAIKKQGDWVPTAWPHDGHDREKGSGIELIKLYQAEGLKVMHRNARYDDDVGGAQKLEPVVKDIYQRMTDGRFKVFSTCDLFFDEMRSFHRKDGVLSKVRDDVIKAVFYAMMDLRYAQAGYMIPRSSGRVTRRAARQWGS